MQNNLKLFTNKNIHWIEIFSDKYRTKSKDHSNYMVKFPKDVETAEILTNGDPNILYNKKFDPEKKPDVSRLFGEKNYVKKKRIQEVVKKSNDFMKNRISHPRFLRENDHEIRIRQQPINQSSTSNTMTNRTYPCQFCRFTATRVNVIICHLKSHKFDSEMSGTKKLKLNESKSPLKELPKRKYVRKSVACKNRNETCSRLGKRKQPKPIENVIKKKKSDPELRNKLLADWNVDSDEDEFPKTIEMDDFSNERQFIESIESSKSDTRNSNSECEQLEILQESSQLLKETEKFSKCFASQNDSTCSNVDHSEEEKIEKSQIIIPTKSTERKAPFHESCMNNENKISRLSCFDFEEEDLLETSTSNVKKVIRGHKDVSLKKEIIKEIELSQALKIENSSENLNVEMSPEMQDDGSLFKKKAEIQAPSKSDETKVSSTVEAFETQVEIVEILEIQKEYREKFIKSELIDTVVTTDLKMKETKKLENEDNFFSNTDHSEKFIKESCDKEKKAFKKVAIDNFVEDCKKKNVDPKKEDGSRYSDHHEEKESSASKIANNLINLNKVFNEEISHHHLSNELGENFVSMAKNLSLLEDSSVTIEKRRKRASKSSDNLNPDENPPSTLVQDCFHHNKKIEPKENDQSPIHVKSSSFNDMQKTDQTIMKKSETFRDIESNFETKIMKKTQIIKKVTEQCILDHKNIIEQKSKTKKKDKHDDENSYSEVFTNDFNKFDNHTKTLDEESSKWNQNNTIDSLSPGTSYGMSTKAIFSNQASGVLKTTNETTLDSENILSKNNTSLLIPELRDSSKEKKDDKEETLESINEKPSQLANDKSPLIKSKVDAKTPKNCYSKTAVLKKGIFNEVDIISQQGATFLHEDEVQKSTDIHLDRTNSILITETSDYLNNTNLQVDNLELKNMCTIKTISDDFIQKIDEHGSLINEKFNQPGLCNNKLKNAHSSSLVEAESSIPTFSADLKQSSNLPMISPLPNDKLTIPVKKREKPRIIENVALKEPMILKTKLSEKHLCKIRKHKLEIDCHKSYEFQRKSEAKLVKLDNVMLDINNESSSVNINKSLGAVNSVKLIQTRASSLIKFKKDVENKPSFSTSPAEANFVCSQKYVPQNSNNLEDTELDISSMPFVLSEDMLTSENIEHIPVVMSTIKLKGNVNLSKNESKETNLSLKKKSGTPAILKSKIKIKPAITSIKTIVPSSSTASYKGIYKIDSQNLKSSSGDQKMSGKYVIVQTSGNQDAYSKYKKLAIPTCKDPGNAKIVQQGGKVVILTSPQAVSTNQDVLPLSSLKSLNTGKTKKTITSKTTEQVCESTSFHNIPGLKSTPLSKTTDHKLTAISPENTTRKIIRPQQTIISKSVLMPSSSGLSKRGILNNPTHSITAKSNIFAQIDANSSLNKSSIIHKNVVSQNIATTKEILCQTSQSFPTKTIISSKGLISKGTVLTPITGSQVKALAAKNIKANKKQGPIELNFPSGEITSSDMLVLQQNKKRQTFTVNRKLVEQKIEKTLNAVETLSSFSSNTHIKDKVSLSNQNQLLLDEENNSSVFKQDSSAEENDERSSCELLMNYKSPTKFNKDLDVELVHTSIIQKTNIETIEELKRESLKYGNNSSSISSTTNSPGMVDIPKILCDSTSYENLIPKLLTLKPDVNQVDEKKSLFTKEENVEDQKNLAEAHVIIPTEADCDSETYVFVTVDEQGNIVPLDNNAVGSIDALSSEENRTLYIDTNSSHESETVDKIVLQIEKEPVSNLRPTKQSELYHVTVNKACSVSDIVQTANHDILAAALANTDFQQEIGMTNLSLPMNDFTQTSLINQTILQSTIIPPSEPISSPLVLETSLTLNQPIMTPLEVPSNLSSPSELVITGTKPLLNQNLLDKSDEKSSLQIPRSSMFHSEKNLRTASQNALEDKQCSTEDISDNKFDEENSKKSLVDSSYHTSKKIISSDEERKTPSMPIIDNAVIDHNTLESPNISIIAQDTVGNDSLQVSNLKSLLSIINRKEPLEQRLYFLNVYIYFLKSLGNPDTDQSEQLAVRCFLWFL